MKSLRMSALEICSLVLLFIGNILIICCVTLPYWKINDPEDTVRDTVLRHEGLWVRCITIATGNWDCDDFNRFFLGLPSSLQAARGMSVSSIALGILSIFIMSVGMESVPFGGDRSVKRRTRILAGVLGFLGAALIIAAVSWFANDVRIEHEFQSQRLRNNPFANDSRDVFGASLFLGWTGGLLLILGSLLASCTVCGPSEDYDNYNPAGYTYKPPKKALTNTAQEYV